MSLVNVTSPGEAPDWAAGLIPSARPRNAATRSILENVSRIGHAPICRTVGFRDAPNARETFTSDRSPVKARRLKFRCRTKREGRTRDFAYYTETKRS